MPKIKISTCSTTKLNFAPSISPNMNLPNAYTPITGKIIEDHLICAAINPFPASTGKPKTTFPYQTIPVAVRLAITVTCATAGNSKNTILPTTKLSNARFRAARRAHVLTTTPRNKKGPLKARSSAMPSDTSLKTE